MDDIVDLTAFPSGTLGYARSNGATFGARTSLGITGSFAVLGTADVNGDGLVDILYQLNATAQIAVLPHNGANTTADLATSFSDGFGISFNPVYAPIDNSSSYTKGTSAVYPESDYSGPRNVVTSYTASNGVGSSYTVTQTYLGARVNQQGLGFEGFTTIKSVDSRNAIETDSSYTLTFPNSGMLSQQTTYQPGGTKVISQVVNTNTYSLLDSTATVQRWFPYLSQSVATTNEVGGALDNAPNSQVTTQYTYAGPNGFGYGNPSQIVRTTVDRDPTSPWSGSSYTQTLAITPYELGGAGATGWCIHLPSQIVETRTQPSSSQTHTASFTVNANSECETDAKVVEPTSSTDRVTTSISYDACGNVGSTSVTGSNADGSSMAARTVTSAFGTHCIAAEAVTNPLGQISLTGYRYDLGLPVSSTDPNGLTTSWTYNDIGQKILEQRPDGTQTAWSYTACSSPSYCGDGNLRYEIQRTENDATSGHTGFWYTAQFFDQFDRMLYDEPQQSNGAQAYRHTFYDALGRLTAQTSPFGNGFSAFTTNITYDLIGRESTEVRPKSATDATLETVSFGYQGRTLTRTDHKGYTTTQQTDVLGRLGIVTDPDGSSKTIYAYGPFGQLYSTRDPGGNFKTKTYDSLGYLVTGTADPDRGGWTLQYNSLGELTALRDAKTLSPSWTQTLSYDALGRLTQRVEAEGTSTWAWGTSAAAREIGQLTSITGLGDTETYSYDSFGRLAGRTMAWGSTTYSESFNYNSIGKLNQITYPLAAGQAAAFSVLYGYSNGYLSSIQKDTGGVASTVFWQLTPGTVNMDPWGHVLDETLGTGSAVRVQSTYDSVTGLMTSHTVGSGGNLANLQNLSYQWDPNNNLSARVDQLQGLTEAFTYDNLDRFQTAALNGVQSQQLAIDSSGNITSSTANGVTSPYTYDATHVHAVATFGTGANQISYTYDPNGNMATRNGSTLTWASYNLPTSITGSGGVSSAFSYGPDRQRKQQVAQYVSDGGGGLETTVYAFNAYELEATSYQTHNKYIINTPSGTRILYDISTRACPTATFITADHLGSGSLFLNNAGAVILSESFAAYGSRRSSNWSGALSPTSADYTTIAGTTRRGYTDGFHESLDNLGLIHMNGRVYDPAIGRFLSADPVPGQLGDSQSLNPYSYVMNRPLVSTDPTGLAAANWNRDGGDLWAFASFGQECDCGSGSSSGSSSAGPGGGSGGGSGGSGGGSSGSGSGTPSQGNIYVDKNGVYTIGIEGTVPRNVDPNFAGIFDHALAESLNSAPEAKTPKDTPLINGWACAKALVCHPLAQATPTQAAVQTLLLGAVVGTAIVGPAAFGGAAVADITTISVFWSGGTEAAAAEWAAANGGTTLEMTEAGQALLRYTGTHATDTEFMDLAWRAASKEFADAAVGEVHVFLGNFVRAAGVWRTVELPALLENPAVQSIFYH